MDFLTKKKKVNKGEIPQYYVEGNHEAIIQPNVFELVQRELEQRQQRRGQHSGVHLFSCRIKCGVCGSWYGSKTWHSNDKYRRIIWQCNHKFEGDEKCSSPHFREEEIEQLFVKAVNKLISQKDVIIGQFDLVLRTALDTTALETERDELQNEMLETSELMQNSIYENAHIALDQTEYQKRYDALTARFDKAKSRLETVDAAIKDKQSRHATIEAYLKTLKA